MIRNGYHPDQGWLRIALTVFLLAVSVSSYFVWVSDHHRLVQRRADVSVLAAVHANSIQLNIERALSATYALAAQVRQSNGKFPAFEALAEEMLPLYRGAASLQLAPGGIVSRIVPLEGNEKAIGHNLLKDPERDKDAILARTTGKLTLAGPFKPIQGGVAAAGRLPVYLGEAPNGGEFWGFVTVLIRFPDALVAARLPDLEANGYDYELWHSDPKTGEKKVIAASSETALQEPVGQSIEVPNATWTLSVAPKQGWRETPNLIQDILVALLISVILAALGDSYYRLRRHKAELETRVRQRTRELAESEQKLLSILDGVEAYIYIKDTGYRYQFANQPLRDLYKVKMEGVVGCLDECFYSAESAATIHAGDKRVIEQGETVRTELDLTFSNSRVTRSYYVVKLPLRRGNGQIYGLCGISTDITERKANEIAVAHSEARYRALFADSTVVMLLIDPSDGAIVDANNAAAAYYGYAPTELTAMNINNINTLSPDQIRREMSKTKTSGRKFFEFRHRLASGEIRDVQVSSGPIVLDGRTLLLSTVHDITAQKGAEQTLRENENRFRSLVGAIENVSIQGYDRSHKVIFWNKASEALYGFTQEEVAGKTLEELTIPQGMRGLVSNAVDDWIQKGVGIPSGERILQRKDGREISVYTSHTMRINSRGEPELYLIDVDLSMKYEAEARMREALIVFNSSSQGIMTTDANGVITSINPAFSTITGFLPKDVIGMNPSIMKSGRHSADFYQAMWADLVAKGCWEGEIWNRRKNGEIYPQWLSITRVPNAQGQDTYFVGLFSDITERKQQEEIIWRQANFDSLTGLANRNLLADRLERAMAQARRNQTKVGLIFLDLDGFKWINDSLGHDVGDHLLIEVAQRLRGCIREQDTAARLGGDEFTAVIYGLTAPTDLIPIGEKLVNVLHEPFTLIDKEYQISGSVGITIYPDDGEDVQTLLKNADIAMYQAKLSGKNRYQFYARHMQVDTQARMQLEIDLREAIAQDAFVLHYQPLVDADSGELVGAEALIRWQHPQRGVISPLDFIPVAEDCGLIVPIGEWVLREAASQLQRWRASGYPALRLSVNVSGVQFREANMSNLVASILSEYNVDPGCLMLEITESVLMDGSKEAEARMHQIKALGVGYALDDFGTGFSSLSYLKRFPIDVVKIDRSFVNESPHDSNDAHLVEAIINMAHSLNLRVTAEGVETEEQRGFLRELGCDYLQGYLAGRPLPAEAFEVQIQRRQLLLPADGATLEESRFLAALRDDRLDLDGWLHRLLDERSAELLAFANTQDWSTHGLDLKHAIQSHLDWRRRLDGFVSASMPDELFSVDEAGAFDLCVLGRWLRGHEKRDEPVMLRLDQVHREFHRLAGQIVSDCSQGQRDMARRTLSGIRFRKASRDVVTALINYYQFAADAVNQ